MFDFSVTNFPTAVATLDKSTSRDTIQSLALAETWSRDIPSSNVVEVRTSVND